jgi:hypothetical protein
MIRAIFSLFRHGRAEAHSLRHDPLILFRAFAPTLLEQEEHRLSVNVPVVIGRWCQASESPNVLRLTWAVLNEGGR